VSDILNFYLILNWLSYSSVWFLSPVTGKVAGNKTVCTFVGSGNHAFDTSASIACFMFVSDTGTCVLSRTHSRRLLC